MNTHLGRLQVLRLSSIVLLAAGLVSAAQASVVTIGSLSRSGGSHTITDSLNNREWLGWDYMRGLHLTYAQTLAATAAGGVLEGYKIARNADAQKFAQAMLGAANACTLAGESVCARGLSADIATLTGESYTGSEAHPISGTVDQEWTLFLSDNGTGGAVGLLEVATWSAQPTDNLLYKANEWGSIPDADAAYANRVGPGGQDVSVGWLMYRDAPATVDASIPEPGSLALTGLALLGVFSTRRRPQPTVP